MRKRASAREGDFRLYPATAPRRIVLKMDPARRYFRAIESVDGWECHQGSLVIDSHGTFMEAADHLAEIGEAHAPAEVFAHHLDGTVISVAIFG